MENRLPYKHRQKFNVPELFFLLFWLFKPLYLLESGTFQIADLMLVISFVCILVQFGGRIYLDKLDKMLLYFIFFVILINLIYFVIFGHNSFILSCLYYIYNLMGVMVGRFLLEQKSTRLRLMIVLMVALLLQLLICLVEVGSFEGDRYIGSFNDPNQFGFYVLSSYFIILIINGIDKIISKKAIIAISAIVIFLIIKSASMGMLSSFFVLLISFYGIKMVSLKATVTKRIIGLIMFVLATVAIVLLIINFENIVAYFAKSEILFLRRISNKIGLLYGKTTGNYSSIKADRNWQLLSLYPKYLIFGAGQGFYERFTAVRIVHEVHSTWLGILFSYGAIPTIIFLMWTYKNVKDLPNEFWCIYIALFYEALMLVNQRQPAFWILIVLANIAALEHSEERTVYYV